MLNVSQNSENLSKLGFFFLFHINVKITYDNNIAIFAKVFIRKI